MKVYLKLFWVLAGIGFFVWYLSDPVDFVNRYWVLRWVFIPLLFVSDILRDLKVFLEAWLEKLSENDNGSIF